MSRVLVVVGLVAAVGISSAFAERTTTSNRASPPHAAPAKPAPKTPPAPATPPAHTNPLMPAPIDLTQLYADLSLIQKMPQTAPAGFEPLYTAEEWQAFRARFGADLDAIGRLKSSGIVDLANRLIAAAGGGTETPATRPSGHAHAGGFQRLCLLRAAAICYRNRDGFPTANKAVMAYQEVMDRHTPSHVGALWSISNAMSRMAVTPKPERVRYDGIAARANMQLCMLLVELDQVEAAQGMIRQIGYHEGWLRKDPAAGDTRTQIAQVRARVNSVSKMMDWLGAQYEPAIRNDVRALTAVYLYGRYVKGKRELVADLPARVPTSPLAQLFASLDAAEKDPAAAFAAAENLRTVAGTLPDGTIKERALYAALQHYRAFLAAPQTERDRVKRTLARMSLEAVLAEGARSGKEIDVFGGKALGTPEAPTTQPATVPVHVPPVPELTPATRPAQEIRAVG